MAGRRPEARLKILRVIARLNVGGPARQVALLSDRLRNSGYDTTVVYGDVEPSEASFEHLLDPSGRSLKLADLGRRVRPLSDLRAFAGLVRAMFRERPDVVHTHTAKAGALGRAAAGLYNATRGRSRRAIVVHTFHGHVLDGYFRPAANMAIRTAERVLATLTDRIVAIAPGQRDELVERFRIASASKVDVVRLGLDLSRLLAVDESSPDLRGELSIGAGQLVIGYVGRLVPIKSVDTLLRAFAGVRREQKPRLVIVGEGPERAALESLAAGLGIADRVSFTGWRQDLEAVYRTFDITAVSSRNEGTPVALIEAMAAGRAVVATRVGGVPDVVTDESVGLLVEPGDAGALSAALESLGGDPAARRRMGAAARRSVASRYSVDRLVADLDRLYRQGLAAKRGQPPAQTAAQ